MVRKISSCVLSHDYFSGRNGNPSSVSLLCCETKVSVYYSYRSHEQSFRKGFLMQDEGAGLHESLLWRAQHEPCSQGAKEMRVTFCNWAERMAWTGENRKASEKRGALSTPLQVQMGEGVYSRQRGHGWGHISKQGDTAKGHQEDVKKRDRARVWKGGQRPRMPHSQAQTTHRPVGAHRHTAQRQFLPHPRRHRPGRGLHWGVTTGVWGHCSLEEALCGTAQTQNTG